jgi:hypothetical protein
MQIPFKLHSPVAPCIIKKMGITEWTGCSTGTKGAREYRVRTETKK